MYSGKINIGYRFHSLEVNLEQGDSVVDGFVKGTYILRHLVHNYEPLLLEYKKKHGRIRLDELDFKLKVIKEQTDVERELAAVPVPKQYRDGDECPKCNQGTLRTDGQKRWLFCSDGDCNHHVLPEDGAIL